MDQATLAKLPVKERCEEVLKGPNFDVDPWTCPLCQEPKITSMGGAIRAHWIADHVLTHIRLGHTKPKAAPAQEERLTPGVRPIELD